MKLSLPARLSHRLAMHLPFGALEVRGGPLVSLTFDDVPVTAATTGAAILDSFGARGTYYVASGLMGALDRCGPVVGPEHVAALHGAGHEIGLHTHLHRSFAALAPGAVAAELARNRAALRAVEPGLALENFAYPFGVASVSGKVRLRSLVRSSRGVRPGVNSGWVDPHLLRAVMLYEGAITRACLARWLDETLARRGWLILLTHDVAADPSPYGCTPGLLAALLEEAARRGLPCVTVADALRRLAEPLPARLAPARP